MIIIWSTSNCWPKIRKRIGDPNTSGDDILWRYRDGIWQRKMCHANNEMRKKTINGKIWLINKEKIRMLGEKESYKYLVTLEVDTIKQVEMKENFSKEYLRRTRKLLKIKQQYSRNLIKEINALGCSPLWDTPDHS